MLLTELPVDLVKQRIYKVYKSMLFSLIAPSILRFKYLFQYFDSKELQWTLIEDVIVGFFNNKLYFNGLNNGTSW